MQVIGVVGYSDVGKTTLVERLVDRLEQRGTVGTVKHLGDAPDLETAGTDTARHRGAGAAVTYGLRDDASWFATGDGRSLQDVLDHLAPRVDYAVLEGFSQAAVPQAKLGERPAEGTVVYEAAHADAVDLDALVAAVHDTDPYETLESLVARIKRSERRDLAGAIATFTGRVRRKADPEDAPTEQLEYERYDDVAAQRQAEIREELEAREGVLDVLLYHKVGVVEANEDIVHVVVLAGHRAEAFAAVEDGIDRLKAEVPIFKKEVTVEDAVWAHER